MTLTVADASTTHAAWRDSAWLRTIVKLALLGIALALVLLYRRPDQVFIPAVWAEDGLLNVPDYAAHGWGSLFSTIQGYYSLPVKFLHALAEAISFRWLPELGFWFAAAFSFAVLAVIATAPTTLRLPFVCALVVLLVPTDPEVFGVSLYAGWWGSLLALPPLFWREDGEKPRTALRVFLVVLAGLSSPFPIALVPLFALRAFVRRTRADIVVLVAGIAASLTQYLALRSAGVLSATLPSPDPLPVVDKFFGYYVLQPSTPGAGTLTLGAGLLLVAFVALAWYLRRHEYGLTFVLLAGALAAAIATTLARMPIEVLHPKLAGPRYFFFPFVLLGWMLVQIAAAEREVLRVAAVVILALALRNGLEVAQRRHDRLNWRGQVNGCLLSPSYVFQVHTDGRSETPWNLPLSNVQCRQLVGRSLFDNQ